MHQMKGKLELCQHSSSCIYLKACWGGVWEGRFAFFSENMKRQTTAVPFQSLWTTKNRVLLVFPDIAQLDGMQSEVWAASLEG